MENKIISMTIIKNEEKRFLNKWLENLISYADYCVIVDDASTDNTRKIIIEFMKKHNQSFILKEMKESLFKTDEIKLRGFLWEETRKIAKEGDICIVIDADELMCDEIKVMKPVLLNIEEDLAIGFKKIEMWDDDNYRVDKLWSNYFVRGFKFKNESWGFTGKGLHLPCVPSYVFFNKNVWNSGIRVKHLAYCTPELRKEKSKYALANCNKKDVVNYPQLKSILDEKRTLVKFTQKISTPRILLAIPIVKHYDISSILERLKRLMYDPKKLSVTFFVYKCNPKVFKQLEKFIENSESKIDVVLQNFKDDHFDDPINNKLTEVFYEMKKKQDFDYYFVLKPEGNIEVNTIVDMIGTDRDIVFSVANNNVQGLFISKELINKYPPQIYSSDMSFDSTVIKKVHDDYIWFIADKIPFPAY